MYITEPPVVHTYIHTYRKIFQSWTDRSDYNSFPTFPLILIGISHKSHHRCSSTLHLSPGPRITDNRWIARTFHTAPLSPGSPPEDSLSRQWTAAISVFASFQGTGLLFQNTFIQGEMVTMKMNMNWTCGLKENACAQVAAKSLDHHGWLSEKRRTQSGRWRFTEWIHSERFVKWTV